MPQYARFVVGIVVAGDPHRAAAGLPLVALRPRLAAGLAGRGHRVRPPHLLAGVGIERRDEAANAELAAGRADHHLAVGDQRRERHVVAGLVVGDLRRPDFLAGLRVERDEHGFAGGEEHLVAVERDAAARVVQRTTASGHAAAGSARARAPVLRVDRDHLVARRRDEHHAVVHDRRRLVAAASRRSRTPTPAAAASTLPACDLLERAVAPAVVRAADHQPVAVFGLLAGARP